MGSKDGDQGSRSLGDATTTTNLYYIEYCTLYTLLFYSTRKGADLLLIESRGIIIKITIIGLFYSRPYRLWYVPSQDGKSRGSF